MKNPTLNRSKLILFIIVLLKVPPLQAQDFIDESFSLHPEYFYLANFDTFGESVDPDKEPFPLPTKIPTEIEDQVYLYLLDQAAWILSGTIFGFNFEYQPSDKKRNIPEQFKLSPIASIPKGSKRLQILETGYSENGKEIFIKIRYFYSASEKKRIALWKSTTFPSSGGVGHVPITTEDSNKKATTEGIKEAIRNHIRPIVRNKPGKISGIVTFRYPPIIFYTARECQSKVTVTLRYDRIEHDRFPEDIE